MNDDDLTNMNLLTSKLILMSMNQLQLYEQQDDNGVNDVDEKYLLKDDNCGVGYSMAVDVASLA
jgi:hypothetical protein